MRHFFLGCLSEMGWCYHKSFCLFFFLIFTYLAVPGLRCGMEDLRCSMWGL